MEECPHCNTDSLFEKLAPPDSPHWKGLYCANCSNRLIRWIKKPENNNRRANKKIRSGVTYCELCLRDKEEMLPTWTEEHHILPFKTHPELDNDVNNRMVLCLSCHTIIEAIRRISRAKLYTGENDV